MKYTETTTYTKELLEHGYVAPLSIQTKEHLTPLHLYVFDVDKDGNVSDEPARNTEDCYSWVLETAGTTALSAANGAADLGPDHFTMMHFDVECEKTGRKVKALITNDQLPADVGFTPPPH